jgi:hypothetical protein
MPKVAVHENYHPASSKYKIGATYQFYTPAPTFDALRPHERDKSQFGRFIPPTPHAAHYQRAFIGRKNISHRVIGIETVGI